MTSCGPRCQHLRRMLGIAKIDCKEGVTTLLRELAEEDPKSFINIIRMSVPKFEKLLEMITSIKTQDTRMRMAIPCRTKLPITLRYLAGSDRYLAGSDRYLAGSDRFRSLEYLFRVPCNTISVFLPMVSSASFEALCGYIKASVINVVHNPE
ncbi:hypothetical protein PR048_020818 [Dryococelus australis]|uniref:Uncharacterized protein n=1 Tax=Dryococelus australis TaxID=614101 RepID=A0ABQ9GWG7_9NEOP|nr:hypothetical protein PR048_020818 [Dryococelus australis]